MNETTLGQFLRDHLDGAYMPMYTLSKIDAFEMYAYLNRHHPSRNVATRVAWTWRQGEIFTVKVVTDAESHTTLFNYYPTGEELKRAELAENGPE